MNLRNLCIAAIAFTFIICPPGSGQTDSPSDTTNSDTTEVMQSRTVPGPPTDLRVKDSPDDAGGSLHLSWKLSPEDPENVVRYLVVRSETPSGPFTVIGETTQGRSEFTDNNAATGEEYYYRVVALPDGDYDSTIVAFGSNASLLSEPVKSTAQWFHGGRFNILVGILAVSASILIYINRAKAGKKLYIRKIAGIEAVDDAIGRATEMGRKIFYIPGIQDMNDMQTVASIPILGRVAEICARNETYLQVPVSRSLVMVTAREAVRDAYTRIGRPDAFQEDQVHYLTDDQFGYAAAIDGMVVREQPATIFYMGAFFAESLILAETGNAAGAIQIAGTAMPAQLPFFVVACDYTLIGEELFAASAYLSRESKLLGSLKGQDFGKLLALIAIVVGIILELIGIDFLQILETS